MYDFFKRLTIGVLVFLVLGSPVVVHAQRVRIDIQAQGFAKLNVAMPLFSGPAALTRPFQEVCARDVKISGVFNLLDSKGYLNPGPLSMVQPGTVKDWALIGADFVIAGHAAVLGDNAVYTVQVTEVSTGSAIMRNTYTVPQGYAYRAVHEFMDSFLRESMGIDGFYASKLACTRKSQGKKELYTAWCDGSGGRVIKGLGDLVVCPAWSPDASQIAFVSYWRDNPDLYLLDLDRKKVDFISNNKGINTTPAFTPHGDQVAFTMTKDGNPEIYLKHIKSGVVKRLTNNWGTDTSPSFSPDGRHMVFNSSRGGNPQIYIMELATQKVRRLTFCGTYNTEPVFSPRGDLVAFCHSSPEDKRFHVAVIRPDGTGFRVLPGTGRGDESPAFSPDGRLLAFGCSDGNIYITDLAGNPPVRVTDGAGFYAEPAWSGCSR